jgi:hypothetical protein
MQRRYFRGDAAFANPEVYEFLETEGYKYSIPDFPDERQYSCTNQPNLP